MRLAEVRVELEGTRDGDSHFADALLAWHVAEVDARTDNARLRGVREREVRRELDRAVQEIDRLSESVRAQPGAQVQSAEIQVVRLETWRPLRPRRGGARWELQFQRGGDLSRDLVLDGDDVRHLAVVVICPDVVARFGVDQLRRHAKPI